MLKVGAVNRELIVGVKLPLECVVRIPRIITAGLEYKHSVIYCWTAKVTEHVYFWRRRVRVGVRCEYNVPIMYHIISNHFSYRPDFENKKESGRMSISRRSRARIHDYMS